MRLKEYLNEMPQPAIEKIIWLFAGARDPQLKGMQSPSAIKKLIKDPKINKLANELWMQIQLLLKK
jgi:hypothetical protein